MHLSHIGYKCKHVSAQCFCFDLNPEEQHELCDAVTQTETFTAACWVCRKAPWQHFGVQACMLISSFLLEKVCASGGWRGEGCRGCVRVCFISPLRHQPSHRAGVYLRRVFKASEWCQTCEAGMRAAASPSCVFLRFHRAVNERAPPSVAERQRSRV